MKAVLLIAAVVLIAGCFKSRSTKFYDSSRETCDSTKYECKDLYNLKR